MAHRQTLVRVVWALGLLGIGFASVPFLHAPLSRGSGSERSTFVVDIGDLAVGEPSFVEFSPSRTLIVLKPSAAQLDSLRTLDSHVWRQAHDGEVRDSPVFVYWALSTGRFGGCRLRHYAAGNSLLGSAAGAARWHGGYWAAGCDASYDYAGRAIKTRDHSYSGYVARSESLRKPRIVSSSEDRIVLTLDSR